MAELHRGRDKSDAGTPQTDVDESAAAGESALPVEIPFHGETLRIIGLEDFVAMKLFAR
jgi:hypothetical protein